MNKRDRNRRKTLQALCYVIISPVIMVVSAIFIVYMYFSGTFLPGMHIERYTLYAIFFILIILSLLAYNNGREYINRIRRNNNKRR